MAYWQYQPYIGIGAGAHGRIPINDKTYLATETYKMPNEWLNNPTYFTQSELITHTDYDIEYLLMSLRTHQGCAINRFQTSLINYKKIDILIQEGLMTFDNNILIATKKGRPILNLLLQEIIN
jgi:oxygen-independent coproporphyrinogen-3 oxidase